MHNHKKMFTLEVKPIESCLIQFESKFNYNETFVQPIGNYKMLSDIWKPSYFCWSKQEVQLHLTVAIETCDDILLFGTKIPREDIKKIIEFKKHLNEILSSIFKFRSTDTFRY